MTKTWTTVPVPAGYGTSEIRHVLRESSARALILDDWRPRHFPFETDLRAVLA